MKKASKLLSLVLVLILCLGFVACKDDSAPASDKTDKAGEPGKKLVISLGAGPVGGVYYMYGSGLAQIITDFMEGVECTAEQTGGSAVNVAMVDSGEIMVGMSTDSTANDGMNGIGWADGVKYPNVRGAVIMYPSALEIFALASSDIKSIEDFEGKIVTCGTSGGSGDTMSAALFEVLNIKPKQKQFMGWSDAVGNIKDGLIDAGLDLGGFPHASRQELSATHDVRWIELTEDQKNLMKESYSYYKDGVEPAGTYSTMTEDYHTLFVWNDVMVNVDCDADFVYNLCKTIYDHNAELVGYHSAGAYTLAKNVNNMSIPLHVGAIRYYEELGIEIDPALYPPEYKK